MHQWIQPPPRPLDLKTPVYYKGGSRASCRRGRGRQPRLPNIYRPCTKHDGKVIFSVCPSVHRGEYPSLWSQVPGRGVARPVPSLIWGGTIPVSGPRSHRVSSGGALQYLPTPPLPPRQGRGTPHTQPRPGQGYLHPIPIP